MKVTKNPGHLHLVPKEADAPIAKPSDAPIDVAERAATPQPPAPTGIDAGAARTHLAAAMRSAQPVAIDPAAESALGDLVRVAALEKSDAVFAAALAKFTAAFAGKLTDLEPLLALRCEAIVADLDDAAPFLRRAAAIAAGLPRS
ncbi:MAG: hypothetical protein IT381_23855 [Deltaproteobacteria bacterium]|nr:hypothetical protein [Deltaproteobacteria bacterium]